MVVTYTNKHSVIRASAELSDWHALKHEPLITMALMQSGLTLSLCVQDSTSVGQSGH